MRKELDDIVCKLVTLESGGPIADSILSNQSRDETDDDSDSEPVKHTSMNRSGGPRTPVLPTPSLVKYPKKLISNKESHLFM